MEEFRCRTVESLREFGSRISPYEIGSVELVRVSSETNARKQYALAIRTVGDYLADPIVFCTDRLSLLHLGREIVRAIDPTTSERILSALERIEAELAHSREE